MAQPRLALMTGIGLPDAHKDPAINAILHFFKTWLRAMQADQERSFIQVLDSAPSTTDLADGEMAVSGAFLYVQRGTSLYKVALTLVP